MREKYVCLQETLGEAVDRWWIWLYQYAARRLPADFHDRVWRQFVQHKIEQFRAYGIPDEYILYLAEEAGVTGVDEPYRRDVRVRYREVRDTRLPPR